MFENLRDITIEGGYFEQPTTLTLFKEKQPLSIIYGRNGSGKTTIARIICDIYKADNGRVIYSGKEINSMTKEEYADYMDTAKEYLASHRYLWNSGMFVWKASSILSNLEKLMPDIYEGLQRIEAAVDTAEYENVLTKEYQAFRSESIDFGVMEKADKIYTIPGSFGWDDVGNWLAVERINPTNEYGNYIEGDVITIGTERSTICGGKRLIAAVGVEDIIVVDTDDALLICAKDSTQDVKKVIENLKICNRSQLV